MRATPPQPVSFTTPWAFARSHAPLLQSLYVQAEAARWNVSLDEFAEALLRSASRSFPHGAPGAAELEAYLSGLHLADLALACALRKGSAPAWEEFVARYGPELQAAARGIAGAAGESHACELADSLYADLYGLNRDGGKRPLIEYFHGRSKLSTWLRALLAQRHVDWLRSAQRTVPLDDAAPDGRPDAAPAPDPDRARLLPRLREALASAIAAAPAADRLLLSLYYLQQMSLAQIARLHKVHEATVSRRLDRIRRELRQNIEAILIAPRPASNLGDGQPGLSPAEVELCFSYARQDWGFDLAGALGAQPHSGSGRPAAQP